MGKTKIEWATDSWNPIRARNLKTGKVGWHCEHATTGCEHCYSEGFNKRLGTGLPFKPGHRKDVEIFLDEQMLTQPLRWKKPRRIFVCSMTDAFADFVTDEMLDKMFAVATVCPQHTFQFLTKRGKLMREYMERLFGSKVAPRGIACPPWSALLNRVERSWMATNPNYMTDIRPLLLTGLQGQTLPSGPLPNVWLGVSAERQQEADERIPELLATPAAVRFVSAEPLLGPIDLKRWVPTGSWGTFKGEPVYNSKFFLTKCEHCGWFGSSELCREVNYGDDADASCPSCDQIFRCDEVDACIDWIIVGGESGRNARPMHPAWARSLRDQCRAANVAFFFKQWGLWSPLKGACPVLSASSSVAWPDGSIGAGNADANGGAGCSLYRATKEIAGRLLDGVEHNAFPGVPA